MRGNPSITDVARHAGVSLGTVSNVLNNPAKVAPTTRRKVEEAIQSLGFVRNAAARSLAAGRSATIGFVAADLSNSFFLDMARGSELAAEAAGMKVLLANADRRAAKQAAYVSLFDEERVGGILLAAVRSSLPELMSGRSRNRPIVVLDDPAEGLEVCAVTADNRYGGELAAQHLVELGRRRLAFVGPSHLWQVQERLAGARAAVGHGTALIEHVQTEGARVEHGRAAVRGLLGRPAAERPDGILAGSDLIAVGVVQALLADGIAVPGEVAVTGYDNNRESWDSFVPLTTVAQPGEQMGTLAAELLLEELGGLGTHGHQRVVVRPELVIRESTAGRGDVRRNGASPA